MPKRAGITTLPYLILNRLSTAMKKAGLESVWLELVENVRNNHSRKYSFMPGFEQVAEGKGPSTKPSFIELAKNTCKKK